jgi:hypothetical protein
VKTPPVTQAQLEPLLQKALTNSASDIFVLVRAIPEAIPETISLDGQHVDILSTSSPLEIRARLTSLRTTPLAVLTDCDTTALGDDLVTRAYKQRVLSVDRWATVSQLFGAQGVSRKLAQHTAVADALIETRPPDGYQPIISKILDLDTALDAVASAALKIDAQTLEQLLLWAENPDAARSFRELNPEILQPMEDHLVDRYGAGATVVLASLEIGGASNLTALALAGGVVHHPDVDSEVGRIKLDGQFEDRGLAPAAFRELANAAVRRVSEASTADPVAHWLATSDEYLHRFDVSEHAWCSDVSPLGFEQRLARCAAAISSLRSDPSRTQLSNEVESLLREAEAHLEAKSTPARVQRLSMAARLVRRATERAVPPSTLLGTLDWYLSDGAWFDRARTLVSQGDSEKSVAALCRELTEQADEHAHTIGELVALQLVHGAHHLDGPVYGVEQLLDRFVAPAASAGPVLVLVLDGMGWPAFLDVLERLRLEGWQPQTHEDLPAKPAVLATFPTVTELSRASLLCGTLRKGDKDSERRAFTQHSALTSISKKSHPPQLFHKTDLRSGGLDTLPANVLGVIGDQATKVVGLVLNNIDERLKDVAAPPGGWGLDELAPLREVLAEARRAGRTVVLTADHGHVLERGTEYRQGGGGERWRRPETGPPGAGEVAVRGPRVLTKDHEAILPWQEQLRYAGSRNGYHGGITPAEAIVPAVVLSTEPAEGWESLAIPPPAWWHPPAIAADQTPAPAVTAKKPANAAKKAEPTTPQLFDDTAISGSPPAVDPIAAIMSSDHVDEQLGRLRLDATVVEQTLRLLDSAGGTLMSQRRVADQVGVAPVRMGRTLTQLQRLLNIDGYPVIEATNSEVCFNRGLLETQLGLP